jgi:hypothetical protein
VPSTPITGALSMADPVVNDHRRLPEKALTAYRFLS